MKFTEWIARPGRKIVITDRVKNATRLIRKYNVEKQGDMCRVSCMTPEQIAQELLFAARAFAGEDEEIELLNEAAGVYILDEILCKKQYGLVPKECYCIRTSEVILQSLNQIRMNDVTAAYEQGQDAKIDDIKDMIASYEKQLEEKHLLDQALLFQEVVRRLKELNGYAVGEEWNGEEATNVDEKVTASARKQLQLLLPWIGDCQIGFLEDLELTALEERFLSLLLKTVGLVPEKLTFFSEEEQKVQYGFFKAYGIPNEIRYVINKIVEEGIPYGQVNLFYTSPMYENFIKVILIVLQKYVL